MTGRQADRVVRRAERHLELTLEAVAVRLKVGLSVLYRWRQGRVRRLRASTEAQVKELATAANRAAHPHRRRTA